MTSGRPFTLHIDTSRTWRGGQNQVMLTVIGLRAAGYRTALVAQPDGELARRASEGTDLIALPVANELDLTAVWRLSRILQKVQPDVVHAHDPHGVATAALALSWGTATPRPPLVASRRVDFHIKQGSLSRWKYRQVDLFIAASRAIADMLAADGIPRDLIVTIHEGIDLDHVDAAPAANIHAEFWLPTHAPIVGNIAALVPHKGQRYLIEAARLVLKKLPDVHFLIVGDGELRESLAHQIKEHALEKHVILTGFRPDVLSLLKAFDVFVLSSVTEGLGTSLLDAMAARKPIAASEVGGIPEVVQDGRTGLLVPPRNPQALADAILRILQDPSTRARFGEAGRARVAAEFSADRMVRETIGIYERLAGKTHRADARHIDEVTY